MSTAKQKWMEEHPDCPELPTYSWTKRDRTKNRDAVNKKLSRVEKALAKENFKTLMQMTYCSKSMAKQLYTVCKMFLKKVLDDGTPDELWQIIDEAEIENSNKSPKTPQWNNISRKLTQNKGRVFFAPNTISNFEYNHNGTTFKIKNATALASGIHAYIILLSTYSQMLLLSVLIRSYTNNIMIAYVPR